jgi:DNA-binding FadR family transcriptional regulator
MDTVNIEEDGGRVRKLGERIAERIVAEIVEQGWPVGRNLGTERELLQRYGIARATFREAIRQVERHGAANMRRGAGGGLIVSDRPRAAAIRAMMTFFELTHVSFADQHETREQLEVAAARLAAERASDEEITRLRELVRELRQITDVTTNVQANMRVRVAVAEATGNPTLALFIEALNGVMREILRVLRSSQDSYQRDRELSVDFKDNLVEAIAERNPDKAERLVRGDMRRRLLAMTSAIARPVPPDATIDYAERLPAWWEDKAEGGQFKLADRIVSRMVADVAKLGWKQGHNLGREADLQVRYGVSRAVLREAIRQLELHGIARMRTGLQGGLVIGKIDPGYTVSLVSTYLKSTPMEIRHIWETESYLHVFAAGRLAQIGTNWDHAALQASLELLRVSTPETYLELAHALHRLIADRTGNRALSLFIRVLTQCATPFLPTVSSRNLPYMIDVHERLVAAICAQDPKGAEAVMTELYSRARAWMGAAEAAAPRATSRKA